MDNRDYLQVLLQMWIILFSCEFGMDTKLTSKKACQPYILDFKLKMRLEVSLLEKKLIISLFSAVPGFHWCVGFLYHEVQGLLVAVTCPVVEQRL